MIQVQKKKIYRFIYLKRVFDLNNLLKRKIHKLIKTQFFYWLIIVLVFLNTVIQAIEFHKQPKYMDDFQCKYCLYINQRVKKQKKVHYAEVILYMYYTQTKTLIFIFWP